MQESSPTPTRGIAIYVLLGLAILRLWAMRLDSSFWLDETGTYWVVKDGWSQLFARLHEWPNIATPLYLMVAAAAHSVGGTAEWVMRLPSLLAVGAAAVLVHRLAARLLGPESALPAVALFVCADSVVFAAADARPYGLLLLGTAASTLALVEWLEVNSTRALILYVLAAAFAVHTQYLALPLLLGHAAFAWARKKEGSPVPLTQLLMAGAGIALLWLPLAPLYWSIFRARANLSWAPTPTLAELAALLTPSVPIFAAAVGLLLAWRTSPPLSIKARQIPGSTAILLTVSALLPPLVMFASSTLTSNHVFAARYFIEAQVFLALLGGWAIGRLEPAAARMTVTASILVFSLVASGSWHQWMPNHDNEDWRNALAAVREVTDGTKIPILAQCGYVESATPGFDFAGAIPAYLTSPFDLYPTGGTVIPIPSRLDEGSALYLNSQVVPVLEQSDRFVFVNRVGLTEDSTLRWMEHRLPGYDAERLGNFGRVTTLLFRRSNSAGR